MAVKGGDTDFAVFNLKLQEMNETLARLEVRGLECCPGSFPDAGGGSMRHSGLYIDHGGVLAHVNPPEVLILLERFEALQSILVLL